MSDSADDHLLKEEKNIPETSVPRKIVTIVESTEPKSSSSASKETDPLLVSQKNE